MPLVCFKTPQGLCFYECSVGTIRELMAKLKEFQKKYDKFTFTITLTNETLERKIICEDVWLDTEDCY